MRSEVPSYVEGNKKFRLITVFELVSDPQFTSGYRDRLAGRPPRRLYFDENVDERRDSWNYERGRLVATWLLATGRKPPEADDFDYLILAYRDADSADVVL